MKAERIQIVALCLLFSVAISTISLLHLVFWRSGYETYKVDIYYHYLRGKQLLEGENPYEKILSGNMRESKHYATHFPLFYFLSALTQKSGLGDYREWISFWRFIFFLFNLGIAYLIFHLFYKHKWVIFSAFSSLFWLFNRWTLDLVKIGKLDFIAIFFLLLSLIVFRKYRWGSLFLFSLSLAMKGLAIFLVPLYLIWFWQSLPKASRKSLFLAFLAIMSIPLLTSLPFIFWNAEGFFRSILFNITRYSASHFGIFSMDLFLGINGVPARLPMLCLMGLIYLCVSQRKIGMYTSILLLMFTFIGFNPTLFRHYMCWVILFIPLSVYDNIPQGGDTAGK